MLRLSGKYLFRGFPKPRYVSYQPVLMPSLSPTMTHGTIANWVKKPGESMLPGELLCEIETDKATVGFEIQDEAVLASILISANTAEPIPCGSAIAISVEDAKAYEEFLKLDQKEILAKFSLPKEAPSTLIPPTPTPVSVPTTAPVTPTNTIPVIPTGELRFSPAARFMIHSQNIDPQSIVATGKKGLISKEDVVLALKGGKATILPKSEVSHKISTPSTSSVTHAPPTTAAAVPSKTSLEPINNNYADIPNTNMRKVIAKRLTQSKAEVPHFYSSIDCEIDNMLAFRTKLKNELGVNVSVNDLVIKAAALALRDVPEANAQWNLAGNKIKSGKEVNISVAVATPSGLITPILTNADKRGLDSINSTVKDLATRARDGKLKPEEYQGGSFTISNLGMFGISEFSAVINPPQACILAVGGGIKRIAPPNTPGGKPRVVTVLTVKLSSDRRVVDESIAGLYLQVFREYLSNPIAAVL